jgi:hypothetical protein
LGQKFEIQDKNTFLSVKEKNIGIKIKGYVTITFLLLIVLHFTAHFPFGVLRTL